MSDVAAEADFRHFELRNLSYMFGLIVSIISIFRNERMLFPIIWAVLCFIFLGEETSWFQRVFHYSVPSVEQINAQNEFNLHNLNVLQGSSLIDMPMELSSLANAQNLFRLSFFCYFLIVPLLLYSEKIKVLMSEIGYRKPDAGFILVLFLVFSLSFFLTFVSPANAKDALAETREMLYAFFIMMHVFVYTLPDTYEPPDYQGQE